jgi:hypothetical protein
MDRRQEFLARALEVHRDYEKPTEALRQLLRENKAEGTEWFEASACQQQTLEEWSGLSHRYGNLDGTDSFSNLHRYQIIGIPNRHADGSDFVFCEEGRPMPGHARAVEGLI